MINNIDSPNSTFSIDDEKSYLSNFGTPLNFKKLSERPATVGVAKNKYDNQAISFKAASNIRSNNQLYQKCNDGRDVNYSFQSPLPPCRNLQRNKFNNNNSVDIGNNNIDIDNNNNNINNSPIFYMSPINYKKSGRARLQDLNNSFQSPLSSNRNLQRNKFNNIDNNNIDYNNINTPPLFYMSPIDYNKSGRAHLQDIHNCFQSPLQSGRNLQRNNFNNIDNNNNNVDYNNNNNINYNKINKQPSFYMSPIDSNKSGRIRLKDIKIPQDIYNNAMLGRNSPPAFSTPLNKNPYFSHIYGDNNNNNNCNDILSPPQNKRNAVLEYQRYRMEKEKGPREPTPQKIDLTELLKPWSPLRDSKGVVFMSAAKKKLEEEKQRKEKKVDNGGAISPGEKARIIDIILAKTRQWEIENNIGVPEKKEEKQSPKKEDDNKENVVEVSGFRRRFLEYRAEQEEIQRRAAAFKESPVKTKKAAVVKTSGIVRPAVTSRRMDYKTPVSAARPPASASSSSARQWR